MTNGQDQRAPSGIVSVIIPTLNAAESLPACLSMLRSCGLVREVLVVDGGSRDASCAIAKESGAKLLHCTQGRGHQLAAGAAAAKADWFLFLHADTLLPANWAQCVADFVQLPDAERKAAYFGFALDHRDLRARLLEFGVALRCWLFALSYGDQGLLIHSDLYHAVGGYEPVPLMEDVGLWRRLKTYGRRGHRSGFYRLQGTATTSAARYREAGYLRRSLHNLTCLWLYLRGHAPEIIAMRYEQAAKR